MMRRSRFTLVLAGLALSACGRDEFGGIRQDVTLVSLQGCGEVEAYLKFEATRRMNAQIDSQLQLIALVRQLPLVNDQPGIDRLILVPPRDHHLTRLPELNLEHLAYSRLLVSRIRLVRPAYS